MIVRFILLALGLYITYKLVFELVIPVYRATEKMRRQFGNMQQHMQDQATNGPAGPASPSSRPPARSTVKAGEYIDFEEV